MKKFIKSLIPPSLRPIAARFYHRIKQWVEDKREVWSGKRSPMTPPQRKLYNTTVEEFERVGKDFLRYFIDLGKIKPTDSILDVGCGQGRMAAPLTKYLNKKGRYEGFDIIPVDIQWCRKNISSKYPNFHFQLADIYNKAYFPEGKYKASEYRFPFESQSFDFVYLTSVFTHLLPPDMENYFSEISRVLKPGGHCLITFFLLNEESVKLIQTDQTTQDFKYDFQDYLSIHEKIPEWAVAYKETYIISQFEKNGLKIEGAVHYGSWCGRTDYLSYQDLIVAKKS